MINVINDYMMNLISKPTSLKRHHGPSLLFTALAYMALVFATLAAGLLMAPRSAFPMPFDPVAKAVAYASQYGSALRWGSFFQMGSTIPLGAFAATVVSRLEFLGVRAAGKTIALFGGLCAMAMLMVSALADWEMASPGLTDMPAALRTLQLIGFAAGSLGFVLPLGLFLAGVSLTAGLSKLLPRWVMWLGLALGLACELSTLTVLTWNASIFIPMGRFLSFIWMIAVAIKLPKTVDESQAAQA